MKKLFLITLCLAVALFLLPGVMGSEGWGETLEISGEVTVAEESTDESGEGIDGDEGNEGSGTSDSGSFGGGSKAPQPKQIKPNTSGADYSWTVTIITE